MKNYSFYEELSFKSTLPELGLRRTVKPWNGYYHWVLLTHPLNNIFLTSMPPDKVTLDFTDNIHFASEAFMRLR